jgi:hypothetical protein
MASITFSDVADLQSMHRAFGRDSALAEVRRRWPRLSDSAAAGLLERVLASSGEPPAPAAKVAPTAKTPRRRSKQ